MTSSTNRRRHCDALLQIINRSNATVPNTKHNDYSPPRTKAVTGQLATRTMVLLIVLLLSVQNISETASLSFLRPVVGNTGRGCNTDYRLVPLGSTVSSSSSFSSPGWNPYRRCRHAKDSFDRWRSILDCNDFNTRMIIRCRSSLDDSYLAYPSCGSLGYKRRKTFCSHGSSDVSLVFGRTERRRISRLHRMNRMVVALKSKPSMSDDDDDNDGDNRSDFGSDDNKSAGSNRIPSLGNTNQTESNDNTDCGIRTVNSSYSKGKTGSIDDDRPVYRSKLRLKSLSSARNKTNGRTKGKMYRSSRQQNSGNITIVGSKVKEQRNKTSKPSSSISGNPSQISPVTAKQQPKPSTTTPYNPKIEPPPIEDFPPATTQSSIDLDLEYRIDTFLRGEYDLRPIEYDENTPAPHPGLSPGSTVDIALRALRDLDEPEVDHGARVFLSFCAALSRNDRWGSGLSSSSSSLSSFSSNGADTEDSSGTTKKTMKRTGTALWKEILRGSLTPTMFARRIRTSDEFSVLLDWETLDVTAGTAVNPASVERPVGVGSTVAFVNAAMFFGEGIEPQMMQFTLVKRSGVWLIDSAAASKKEWFMDDDDNDSNDENEDDAGP